MLGCAAALACAMVPAFLVGALSEQIGAEVGASTGAVGATVTVFFIFGAITAVPMGRLTDRVGARIALGAALTTSALATIGLGLLPQTWWHLAALLAAAGCAVGLADTAGARAFSDRVHGGRHGLAFGVKEASVPVASLLAGVAIPVLALTLGWRPTFVVLGALVPLVVLVLPRDLARPSATAASPSVPLNARRTLIVLAAGAAAATGAATAAATFLVPATRSAGLSATAAGILLAVASGTSIAMRLATGWRADATGHAQRPTIAALMAIGTLGLVLLALSDDPLLIVAGTLITFAAGWGWTGLLFLTAVRVNPAAPAAAAGTVLTGLAVGGSLGPVAFGALLDRFAAPTAWTAAAVAMAVGAAATAWTSRRT